MKFAKEQVAGGIFSITRICKLCGISKNTYYNHKHPDKRFTDKFEHIKIKIKKIISKNSAYGVKRIKKALWDDYNLEIGRDALGRLLKLWSLGLKRKLRKSKKSVIHSIWKRLETIARGILNIKNVSSYSWILTLLKKGTLK